MCDSCANIKEGVIDCLIEPILDLSPQLRWLFNGFVKFRQQLPDDVISEIETQISALVKNVAASNYQVSLITDIVTYIILFLVVLFIFTCIIFNNATLTYFLMAISLILIIVGILGILWYANNTIESTSLLITSTTNHLKTIFMEAIDAGLCCINAVDCGNSCTGTCECKNIPNITYSMGISGPLTVIFQNTTLSPILPIGNMMWDFGDGTSQGGINNTVTHTYAQPGTYNTTLSLVLQSSTAFPCRDLAVFKVTSPINTITVT